MPLILLCGHPCSGKTKRAEQLIAYAASISTASAPVTVQLINFETLNLDRNAFYKDIPSEKHGRANIKAAVTRLLNPTRLVICDYNNSIKGYRYEMFCMAREQNTTHAVVYCNTDLKTCTEWNKKRMDAATAATAATAPPTATAATATATDAKTTPDGKTAAPASAPTTTTTAAPPPPPPPYYNPTVFEDVSKRLEEPNEQKKWDHPLFIVKPDDPLPSSAIFAALYDPSKAPKPSAATVAPKAVETNYLFELDKTTQHIIKTIVAAQNESTALATDDIKIPPAAADGGGSGSGGSGSGSGAGPVLRVNFGKKISVAELGRLRRAYLKLAAMRPPQSTIAIAAAFVAFLNSSGKETVKDLNG